HREARDRLPLFLLLLGSPVGGLLGGEHADRAKGVEELGDAGLPEVGQLGFLGEGFHAADHGCDLGIVERRTEVGACDLLERGGIRGGRVVDPAAGEGGGGEGGLVGGGDGEGGTGLVGHEGGGGGRTEALGG